MVNNRQVLKNNLEVDLQRKIELAEEVLLQLRSAVQNVEDNSAKAKGEVNQAVDSIQQLLLSRKLELTRQIDLLCHTQINTLQEGIRTTYITLGSLQSMLSNLDSFDHSQLLNLHIPDLSWAKNVGSPTPLEVTVNDGPIKQDLQQCVNVNAKGLKGLIDVGSSASLPQRFVEYGNGKNDQQFMCHKSVHSGPSSIVDFTKKPINVSEISTNQKINETSKVAVTDKWHMEQWLTEIKSQTCPENEDFELVSVDNFFTEDRKRASSGNENENKIADDDGSSIICIEEKDKASESDMSKWLKPKKSHASPSQFIATVTPVAQVQPNPPSKSVDEGHCATKSAHNPWNNRFVDFPCLRVDPKYWVSIKKRNKSPGSSISINDSEVSLNINQKEIIPPAYALPAPFWLKKYR